MVQFLIYLVIIYQLQNFISTGKLDSDYDLGNTWEEIVVTYCTDIPGVIQRREMNYQSG
jgi:hypothetical protein